jgi:hypothetical protein
LRFLDLRAVDQGRGRPWRRRHDLILWDVYLRATDAK